jgi:hypothetical protein
MCKVPLISWILLFVDLTYFAHPQINYTVVLQGMSFFCAQMSIKNNLKSGKPSALTNDSGLITNNIF